MTSSLKNCKKHSLTTSIKTLPAVIVNQIGFNVARIVHQYYNPQCGWEIAIEDERRTHIILCFEKEKIVKVFYH
tara:strand:- start:564 stop:785 length:222 start_codon:yes stop_codon:yes gene_type:complete